MIRIANGQGFWGDWLEAPVRLVEQGPIDFLVLDYLAEITMSILARMKAKNPSLGYATDFVSHVMKPLARDIAQRGIKVIANAGGVNLDACRDALQAVLREQRVDLNIAIVRGDDTFESGIPESFNVLVKEMRSLGLNVELASTKKQPGDSPAEAAE